MTRMAPLVSLPWLTIVGLDLESDVAVRRARCRACEKMIEPGEPRKKIVLYHPGTKARNDGVYSQSVRYYHPKCFKNAHSVREECVNCSRRLNIEVQRTNVQLCMACVMDPWLGSCYYCSRILDKRGLSLVLEDVLTSLDDNKIDHYCCLQCEQMIDVNTERVERRYQRKERVMLSKMRAVQRDLESWTHD